ncbi:cerebellin-2-like [Cebidichthys violaceus]|uniref:cerebellin-2-like n=1 Tax=Cebidichthys violaceus TaxID=271503 RepID=UPI0035CC2E94
MVASRVLVLVVVVVSAVVGAQNLGFTLNPEKGPEEEDVRVLVQQLMARVDKLEREREEERTKSQVAFSASLVNTELWTHQGPFDRDTTLLFKMVTTNIGNVYDPETGVFTAPVKGLYYIRFTGCVGNSGSLNAALLKNELNMFAIFDTRGVHGSASNGMALVLEAGDRLSVTLWNQKSIFDQTKLSTFSGFLVFPM